ncbi:hypothetical protein C5O00_14300 [Pukyongia salina]|uniref:Secretion system C-terminal sorting domain-containing protein n=1 Tax=Pukyongia salina TaxID=2094025 RepID=A0A2S0I044_9FLAO|nr:T9SS type A sorting domain-containing protein [Pukyongia salina]AVI52265.1 hypothetical protein C5O00_14300 [Pukyongia salina]
MIRNILLFSFIYLFFYNSHAQTVEWVNGTGGPGPVDIGRIIETDSQGNVFVSGSFRDTVSFDPNSNNFDFTAGLFGDAFIQKFDADGNFLWARVFTSDAATEYPIMLIDSEDNIYLSAYFEGSIDLDPGPNQDIRTNSALGFEQSYIVKLNNDGEYIWGEAFENVSANQYTNIQSISFDSNENVFLAGEFQSTIDLDFGVGEHLINGPGGSAFFLKIDKDGEFLWAETLLAPLEDSFNITESLFTPTDEILIAGSYYGTDVDFDPGPGQFLFTSPSTNQDLFILKLDNSGNFLWARTAEGHDPGPFLGIGNEHIFSLDIDSNDDIYITGGYSFYINLEPGTSNFILDSGVPPCTSSCPDYNVPFIAKMSSDGDMIWAKQFDGPHQIVVAQGNIKRHSNLVWINEQGDLIYAINPYGTINFEINSVPYSFTSTNLYVTFLNVDPTNGEVLNVFFLGNDQHAWISDLKVYENIMYVTGGFGGELFFDPSHSLVSNGNTDAYTLKIREDSLFTQEFDIEKAISIYPNPTSDLLHMESPIQDITSVILYDLQGRQLNAFYDVSSKSQTLDLSTLSAAIYIVEIELSNGWRITRKLVKE